MIFFLVSWIYYFTVFWLLFLLVCYSFVGNLFFSLLLYKCVILQFHMICVCVNCLLIILFIIHCDSWIWGFMSSINFGRFSPIFKQLEEEMATHSSILAWRIPWTEEPGGLQSTGSQRVRHDRATSLSVYKQYFIFSILIF